MSKKRKKEEKIKFTNFANNLYKNTENFIALLKVMGNNYEQDLRTQVSITTFKNTSTVCRKFDFWKENNRYVRKGEKGIPILDDKWEVVGYIFDISQTNEKNIKNENTLSEAWRFDSSQENILDNILETEDKNVSIDKKVDLFINKKIKNIDNDFEKNL